MRIGFEKSKGIETRLILSTQSQHSQLAILKMVYLEVWDEYQKAVEELYLNAPIRVDIFEAIYCFEFCKS